MNNIYFTNEEKTEFLEKRGYKVSTIVCFRSENEYHGKVSFYDIDVTIAVQDDVDVSKLEGSSHYGVESEYSLRVVFDKVYNKELKEKIKEMLW